MSPPDPLFKIKVTATDGQSFFWHKEGKIHLLTADLAEIWVTKFKPHLFEIKPDGEMVGAGRDPSVTSFPIAKVEKVPVENEGEAS